MTAQLPTPMTTNVTAPMPTPATTPNDAVLQRLVALRNMDMAGLHTTWRDLYKCDPPKSSNAPYLIKRLSYRIQELVYGGDTAETKARLEEHAKRYFGGSKHKLQPALSAGTILTREYQGVEHQVAVLDDGGFQYNGCKYRSLSAIAKYITGTNWNGRVFFGVIQRAAKA